MRRSRLIAFTIVTLCGLCWTQLIYAQVKDMPSQAEFDPILEDADAKVKDFLSTLTKFRLDAVDVDRERFDKDVRDFQKLREIIEIAHSGKGNHGINVSRSVSILASLDDAVREAAIWSNVLTTRICGPHKQTLLYFALAVQDNGAMLNEVSTQLLHPVLRMTSAVDEVLNALSDAAAKK